MFGLFKKKPPEVYTRRGVEVGEMRYFSALAIQKMKDFVPEIENYQVVGELSDIHFTYHDLPIHVDSSNNTFGLSLITRIPEANIHTSSTISEKARLYRCIDHVCLAAPGSRLRYDQETGELVVGIESAGFDEQFRADTLIDIALYMLENAVYEARTYLGVPAVKPEPIRVDLYDGGYHAGEGFRTFATARDAFADYMMRHDKCTEVSRDSVSILLQSGPVQYEVRGFNWPNAYMVTTATRGFKPIYNNDELYVRVQERLSQPIQNPERPSDFPRQFRGADSTTIAYFQPDGTFVLGQYGFGNVRTEENKKAFERVDSAHVVDVYYMTYLAQELPEQLYSDEYNRQN